MEHSMITLGGGATAAAPGSLCNPALFTLKWGDYMFEREYAQKMHFIQMPQDQWEAGATNHLAAHPYNYTVHRWIAKVQEERLEYQRRASQRVVVEMPDADELAFRVWKDMIEEPYKYGDDIVEWLELDEQVMRGPKRWRAGAFWQTREDDYIAREWQRVLGLLARAAAQQQQWIEEAIAAEIAHENACATRIQALWRGYSTRVRQPWRDCGHCLKHGICVEEVNDVHVCHCCWGEANPVEDDVVTPVEEHDICEGTT